MKLAMFEKFASWRVQDRQGSVEELSTFSSADQRYAKQLTSLEVIMKSWQSLTKPSGWWMNRWTLLWGCGIGHFCEAGNNLKKVQEGGGLTHNLVWWAMGTLVGRVVGDGPAVGGSAAGEHTPGQIDSMATLGGGSLVNASQHGVTWMGWSLAHSGQMVEAGREGGIHIGVGVRATCGISGMATLVSSGMSTLGWLGAGPGVGHKEHGPRRCQDSNRSCRLSMASTWEMHVGGGASLRVLVMTCRLWMILSSAEGDGIVR